MKNEGQSIAQRLLPWYRRHQRELPWRGNVSPYAVWVSEIMLQQTRVETVLPYYRRWMERFPTLKSLAQAELHDVLAAWEGLGYYSRARNLHRAARLVMEELGGELPPQAEALRRLPGIGHYTAGAIASIAFGQDEPALDANARRVLSRVYDLRIPARSTEGEKRLWQYAWENLPRGEAGAFNQALMDLGSLVCTPQNPNCPQCPLNDVCLAYERGVQEERPVRLEKPERPHYTVTAAVITRQDKVLISQRPLDGLLGGLWEFPGGKVEPGEDLSSGLQREILEELGVEVAVGDPFGVYQHGYTHFQVTLHAFCCSLKNGSEPSPLQVYDLRWVDREQLPEYPMGKIDRQIAKRLLEEIT